MPGFDMSFAKKNVCHPVLLMALRKTGAGSSRGGSIDAEAARSRLAPSRLEPAYLQKSPSRASKNRLEPASRNSIRLYAPPGRAEPALKTYRSGSIQLEPYPARAVNNTAAIALRGTNGAVKSSRGIVPQLRSIVPERAHFRRTRF